MLANLLLTVAAVTAAGVQPAEAAMVSGEVRVWLNEEAYQPREEARVYVRTERDGYLLVLHADPTGRVRVLHPLDPFDDNYVRGDKKYEVRGRGDRKAFWIEDYTGMGWVFAAYSPDPFRFEGLTRGDHWDYRLDTWTTETDPELFLIDLAERMSVGGFDYDIVRYEVFERYVSQRGTRYPDYYDPWYRRGGSRFSFSLHIGGHHHYPIGYRSHYWRSPFYYRSRFFYVADPFYYDPFYYDPYYYDPFYDPYYYDPFFYGGFYHVAYRPYWRHHVGHHRTVFVYGIPRGRSVPHLGSGYAFKNPHGRSQVGRVQPRNRSWMVADAGDRRGVTRRRTTGNAASVAAATGRRTSSGQVTRPTATRPRSTPSASPAAGRRTVDRGQSSRGAQPARTTTRRVTGTRVARPRDTDSKISWGPAPQAETRRRTTPERSGLRGATSDTRRLEDRPDRDASETGRQPTRRSVREVTTRREVDRTDRPQSRSTTARVPSRRSAVGSPQSRGTTGRDPRSVTRRSASRYQIVGGTSGRSARNGSASRIVRRSMIRSSSRTRSVRRSSRARPTPARAASSGRTRTARSAPSRSSTRRASRPRSSGSRRSAKPRRRN